MDEEGWEFRQTLAYAAQKMLDLRKSTWWDRPANAHADILAKKGARLHGTTEEDGESWVG